MINELVLVGRLVKTPKLNFTKNDTKVCNITLAVTRPFKNVNGEYETDFIDCTLWNNVACSVSEYCQKGDLIAVKGRVQTRFTEQQNGSRKKYTEIVAEKVNFLEVKKEDEDNKKEIN